MQYLCVLSEGVCSGSYCNVVSSWAKSKHYNYEHSII